MSYLDDSALPFCPGCGHSHVLPAIDKAFQDLGLPPEKIVIVSDIGCVGLSDQYFDTSALHGLHGRSFTYGAGIKLANPDLEVVVLVGDGGCGIGASHLVHAARRNIGIKVIVFNNFNFGMTGGQHSVTTPSGAMTATTRHGHLEAPLDICATVAPSRPSFVARTSTYDPDFGDLVREAIGTDGFAVLDVWELCSAYFGPANTLNKKKMAEWRDSLSMPGGVLVQGDRPEYARALRGLAEDESAGGNGVGAGFDAPFRSDLAERVSILIAGNAGQRAQSAADVLAIAAIGSNLYATQKGSYPVTIKTGFSLADVLISPRIIECTDGGTPDLALVTGPDGLQKAAARLAAMGPDACIVADERVPEFESAAPVHRLDLAGVDRTGLVSVGLGALLAARPVVPLDAIDWAAGQRFNEKIALQVAKLFRAGVELFEPS
jgi:pyruvate/2-oxoacid:ferredoxin oxidoreductase beta subunit/Pyruvate/2-oxoacid:ferredoxin oxidoreductase gamma subunit